MARRRFDQNQNRVDYGELLTADADYVLDQAVGMTYSLDLEALLGVLLCLGMRGEMTSGQRNNPMYALEAIRRTGAKLSIFCNAGCIKVPKTGNRLYALLEESIHEVRMPDCRYNFHPKLWVVQYHHVTDGRIMIKIVTMSRNLTFDESLDLAVEMSGFVGNEVNPKNQPVADLLQFVSQYDSRKNGLHRLIANVKRVGQFDLMDCFEDYEFHSFGIYGRSENGVKKIAAGRHLRSAGELLSGYDSLFVISPFLSEGVIGELMGDEENCGAEGPAKRCLITREESVTKRIFDAFQKNGGDGVFVLDPVLSSNDALNDGDTYGYAKRDVHAKMYYTEKTREPHKLYLGSLNASYQAFHHNVEFLIGLTYKNYHASYRSVMEDFIPEKESPFVRLETFPEGNEESEEKIVDFREEVYGVRSAEVIPEQEHYTIRVQAERAFDGVTIRPFFMKTDVQPLREAAEFHGVPLECLSNLFLLVKDGAECLIRLEVSGMPAKERENVIFNELISNQPMFLTYMRYLLDEDFYDGMEMLTAQERGSVEQAEGYGFGAEPELYERMLRAAADAPERLDAMYEVAERLENDKVSTEFRQLLELFLQTAGRKGKGHR
jgi:hypothetical protein